MQIDDAIVHEIEAIERDFSRRRFLKFLAFSAIIPGPALEPGERDFLRRVSAHLIPADALHRTGIDVVANIEHLINRGDSDHRRKFLQLIAWSKRISFLYGGDKIALRSRGSRFQLARKMGKALSSLCLVAFWGDERALALIEIPRDSDDSKIAPGIEKQNLRLG